MTYKVDKSEKQWRAELTPDEYRSSAPGRHRASLHRGRYCIDSISLRLNPAQAD